MAVTTVASISNAIYELGQQIGLVSNGRDAAERIKTEGWQAAFTTRADAQRTALKSAKSDRLQPIVVRPGKGADRLAQILEVLGRLELTDGLPFSNMVAETESELPRDATVIAVLRAVTPETAIALGTLSRQGYAVSVVVVHFNQHEIPNWARPPAWAELLLGEGLDFKMVTDEESLTNLCAERVLR